MGSMLSTGMPSSALITAYDAGGVSVSRVSSRWQGAGRQANASRSAAWRSATSSVRRVAWAWSQAAPGLA